MKLQFFSIGKEFLLQVYLLFVDLVSCGFFSFVVDYVEFDLDFYDYCIWYLSVIYYFCVSGDSMFDGSFYNGDLLVVDCVEKFWYGDIVVVSVQGEFMVKWLLLML